MSTSKGNLHRKQKFICAAQFKNYHTVQLLNKFYFFTEKNKNMT
jgi:hypothetical protein